MVIKTANTTAWIKAVAPNWTSSHCIKITNFNKYWSLGRYNVFLLHTYMYVMVVSRKSFYTTILSANSPNSFPHRIIIYTWKKNRQTDYSDQSIWQKFPKKWIEWVYHFKENNCFPLADSRPYIWNSDLGDSKTGLIEKAWRSLQALFDCMTLPTWPGGGLWGQISGRPSAFSCLGSQSLSLWCRLGSKAIDACIFLSFVLKLRK